MEKIALLFPGQGSQYIGMGKKIYDEFPFTRVVFEEANDILNLDIKKICFTGSTTQLNSMNVLLPAIYIVSMAYYKAYMEIYGIKPVMAAGHSLGEYTALACSGVLKFSDALKIIRKRSTYAMEVSKQTNGYMTIVNNLNWDRVEKACIDPNTGEQLAFITCYNSEGQVTISGYEEKMILVEDKLIEMGGEITPILSSPPFHSPLMYETSLKLKSELSKIQFGNFRFPVISNIDALPYTCNNEVTEKLTKQLVEPVRWKNIIDYMDLKGVEAIIEIGPQSILTKLLKERNTKAEVYSFANKEEKKLINQRILKKDEDTEIERTIKFIGRCLAIAICTKNNNLNNSDYQNGVIEACERLESLKRSLIESKVQKNSYYIREALDILNTVFLTKKTPKHIQKKRFTQLFRETGTWTFLNDFDIP